MKRCPTAASLVLALALSTPAGADSAPGAYADPARAPASQPQDGWVIDLKGADIHRLIEQIAAITGQTFIVAPEAVSYTHLATLRPSRFFST